MSRVAQGLEGEESERMAAGEISTLYRGAPQKISSVLQSLFTLDSPPWPLLYHTLLPSSLHEENGGVPSINCGQIVSPCQCPRLLRDSPLVLWG